MIQEITLPVAELKQALPGLGKLVFQIPHPSGAPIRPRGHAMQQKTDRLWANIDLPLKGELARGRSDYSESASPICWRCC
jgi:hypothetical protein